MNFSNNSKNAIKTFVEVNPKMYTFYQINHGNSFEAMNYKYCLPENLKIRNFIGRGLLNLEEVFCMAILNSVSGIFKTRTMYAWFAHSINLSLSLLFKNE